MGLPIPGMSMSLLNSKGSCFFVANRVLGLSCKGKNKYHKTSCMTSTEYHAGMIPLRNRYVLNANISMMRCQ
jgi:hypothetical protein